MKRDDFLRRFGMMMKQTRRSAIAPAMLFLAGCPGAGNGIPLRSPLQPGSYTGDVGFVTETTVRVDDGEPQTTEQGSTQSLTVGIEAMGLPASLDGAVRVGDQLVTPFTDQMVILTVTSVEVDGDGVTLEYDISGPIDTTTGLPPAPPLGALGSGMDRYAERFSDEEIGFTRFWRLRINSDAVETEITVNGEGTLSRR